MMFTELYTGNLGWLEENLICLQVSGSQSYGLATATSDTDYKGVAFGPPAHYLGMSETFETAIQNDPDLQIHEIRKFFRLSCQGNPGFIELLFAPPKNLVISGSVWDEIVANRDAFLSRQLKHRFSGYAISQLHRIQRHHQWFTDPPSAPPVRKDYGLPDLNVAARDAIGAALNEVQKQIDTEWLSDIELEEPVKIVLRERFEQQMAQARVGQDDRWAGAARSIGLDDNLIDRLKRERQFRSAENHWRQYQRWLTDRNKDRAELERSHGYDTKHAMHLVRLLRMAREILTTGTVTVERLDREELLGIRAGSWRYEQLVEWAEAEDASLTEVMKHSPLPNQPDRRRLDRLLQSLVVRHLTQ